MVGTLSVSLRGQIWQLGHDFAKEEDSQPQLAVKVFLHSHSNCQQKTTRNVHEEPTLFPNFYRKVIAKFKSLLDPGKPGVRSMAPGCNSNTSLRLKWCDSGWWRYQLNTNRMPIKQSKAIWQCMSRFLVAKFVTTANLEPIELAPPGGKNCKHCQRNGRPKIWQL